MTELDHDGSTLLAEIHGTLTAKHMAARTLTFRRISTNPKP
jgi:hypothetical protein